MKSKTPSLATEHGNPYCARVQPGNAVNLTDPFIGVSGELRAT